MTLFEQIEANKNLIVEMDRINTVDGQSMTLRAIALLNIERANRELDSIEYELGICLEGR